MRPEKISKDHSTALELNMGPILIWSGSLTPESQKMPEQYRATLSRGLMSHMVRNVQIQDV